MHFLLAVQFFFRFTHSKNIQMSCSPHVFTRNEFRIFKNFLTNYNGFALFYICYFLFAQKQSNFWLVKKFLEIWIQSFLENMWLASQKIHIHNGKDFSLFTFTLLVIIFLFTFTLIFLVLIMLNSHFCQSWLLLGLSR